MRPRSIVLSVSLLAASLIHAQTDEGAIRSFLQENATKLGLTSTDVQQWRITDRPSSKAPGVTIVHATQTANGLDVHNALGTFALRDGRVVHFADRFVRDVASKAGPAVPSISATQALREATAVLALALTEEPLVLRELSDGALELSPAGIARDPIRAMLLYQSAWDGTVRLAWDLTIRSVSSTNWWHLAVDANTGELLRKNDYIVKCQFPGHGHAHGLSATDHVMGEDAVPDILPGNSGYRVFSIPVESPNHGPRTLAVDPQDPVASPFGWHDLDGVVGAEHTITRGNNVFAYEDVDDDDQPGYSPDGGASLSFDHPLDLGLQPSGNQDAAITNLFFWSNTMHDVWYQYGFDEQSGNFQETNYGGVAAGSDGVLAEAQDGGGTNNANFASPPDGQNGRMQMYNWTAGAGPDRDGSFDNGVIAHEYGHGISIRLTGGASNSDCLSNAEQMGEGWSDWLGLMLTMQPGAQGADGRGIGTFASGEPVDGTGIRPAPYSTDFAINDYTYAATNDDALTEPHGIGFVWCTMIWDMTWALIDQHGFDPDVYNGTGGNNIAMQLVIEAMKLQPCSPGFVDGRDAILAADELLYAGANKCLIWQAFATRGLGYSADQGSSNSRSDQVEAFDLPNICLTATTAPSADFALSLQSDCGGTVFFTDASTDIPQAWTWDFGDGTISDEQNPTHTYTSSGSYAVTLTVSNSIGSDVLVQQVIIDLPDVPSADDITVCSGSTGTLTAVSSDEVHWYDAQDVELGGGTPFTTPVLTTTTTYLVRTVIAADTSNVGPLDGSIGTGGQHGTAFIGTVNFTAFQPLTIVSAWVDAAVAGNRTFNLWNGLNGTNGAPIQTVVVNVPAGQGRIDLGFNVPAPGIYSVGNSNMNLYRNNAGADYPYTVPGLISLTGSSSTSGPDYYYYLYDLEVTGEPCQSEAVEVTAVVVPGANFSFVANGATLTFTEASNGATSWLWDFGDGTTSTEQNPVHTYAGNGPFTITLSVEGGACSSSQTWELGVGLADVPTGSSFGIAPNPAANFVTISLNPRDTGGASVDLIDAQGRLVMNRSMRDGEPRLVLDVSDLASGTYHVGMRTQLGTAQRLLVITR
jgi:PKD repeat protein